MTPKQPILRRGTMEYVLNHIPPGMLGMGLATAFNDALTENPDATEFQLVPTAFKAMKGPRK